MNKTWKPKINTFFVKSDDNDDAASNLGQVLPCLQVDNDDDYDGNDDNIDDNAWITLDKSCLVSKLTLSTKSSHQPLHIVWKQTFEEYDVADAEKNENDNEVEWGAPKSKIVLLCLKLWPKVII